MNDCVTIGCMKATTNIPLQMFSVGVVLCCDYCEVASNKMSSCVCVFVESRQNQNKRTLGFFSSFLLLLKPFKSTKLEEPIAFSFSLSLSLLESFCCFMFKQTR